MTGNDFISWVLRSPFHGMLSSGMMLISVTGRRTGKKYTTPVEYCRENGDLWVLTSRNRTWWRNVRGGADVKLILKGKTINATAETIMDTKDVEGQLVDYVLHRSVSARALGVRLENKIPNVDDIRRLAKDKLFVKIIPK
jgi:deazaflavin-dependent oxidoreductase (nitroreductase family)